MYNLIKSGGKSLDFLPFFVASGECVAIGCGVSIGWLDVLAYVKIGKISLLIHIYAYIAGCRWGVPYCNTVQDRCGVVRYCVATVRRGRGGICVRLLGGGNPLEYSKKQKVCQNSY